MGIELYVFPPSPRAFKVMALANHLGLDVTIKLIDLLRGDHKSPEYAALNPNMRMPTLKDGDYVLWESNAIAQYLAAKKPQSGLLPTTDSGRLDVTRWQFWDLAHWDPACAMLIFEHVVKPLVAKAGGADPAMVTKGNESFHRAAKVLDAHLEGRKYVAGNALTVADFSLGAPMNLAEMAQFPLDPYGEIKRWYATLAALPAWRQTQAQSAL